MQIEESIVIQSNEKSIELLALDCVLEELEKFEPQKAKIVELRYFGGLSVDRVLRETAHRVPRTSGDSGAEAKSTEAVDGTSLSGTSVSTFFVNRKRDCGQGMEGMC